MSFLASSSQALVAGLSGLSHARRRLGSRVVATAVDRSVVLNNASTEAIVPVDRDGRVSVADFAAALTADTALATLQFGNPEVGTRQPVPGAYAACRARGIPLLLDASAALGRAEIPNDWDVLVGDGASFGGPPLGILVVRPGTRFTLPYAAEAEHRRALAAPWPPLVAALAAAWTAVLPDSADDAADGSRLIDQLRAHAMGWPDIEVLGDPIDRLPHVLTLSALYVDGERLVEELDRAGFAVGSGSACASSRLEPSHVLAAMGALTHGNIRITLPLRAIQADRAEAMARLALALPRAIERVRSELGAGGL